MTNAVIHAAALLLTVSGAACLYLGAPRQRWAARPWPAAPSRIFGAALILLGWGAWRTMLQPETSTFTSLAVAMALFIAFPGIAALAALIRKQ